MEVKLRLDPKFVWQVEEVAEKSGMTFSEFVAGFLVTSLSGGHMFPGVARDVTSRAETVRRVVLFHEQGLTDAEIAVRVDRVPAYVAKLRQSAGLRPNRRRV